MRSASPGARLTVRHAARPTRTDARQSEVLAKSTDAGAMAEEVADLTVSLFVEVESFGLASARSAARIGGIRPSAGLSMRDRACLALATARGLPVLTADRARLDHAGRLGIDIRSIR